MKNVLFVVDEKKMGGVSIVLENILNNIDKSNVNIDLLVLHNNGDRFKNIKQINIIYGTPFFDVIDLSINDAFKSRNVFKIIKKIYLIFLLKSGIIKNKIVKERKKILSKKYDVEIAFKDGFCTIFTAFGDSLKKISWLHTDYSNNNPAIKYKKTFTEALSKLDKIIAISNVVSCNFNKFYKYEEKTEIIYNYVDELKIINESANEKPTTKFDINFLSVGRLHSVKGFDRLISCFAKLEKDNLIKNVSLTIIGDGPEFKKLDLLINENHLENNIFLLGQKDNPYCYFNNADAFILSSHSEGYPLVIIESLILKVPVISVEFSSIYEMLQNNFNGLICKNNADALYLMLKKVLSDKKIMFNLKKNFKKYEYNGNIILSQIETLWEDGVSDV